MHIHFVETAKVELRVAINPLTRNHACVKKMAYVKNTAHRSRLRSDVDEFLAEDF